MIYLIKTLISFYTCFFWFAIRFPRNRKKSTCFQYSSGFPKPRYGATCLRGTNPTTRAPPSWLHHLPEAPWLNTSPWGLGFQHVNLGDTNIQTLHMLLHTRQVFIKVFECIRAPVANSTIAFILSSTCTITLAINPTLACPSSHL